MSTISDSEQFRPFAEQMREAGQPDLEIRTFEAYYRRLVNGETGLIAEADIEPVESLPDVEALPSQLVKTGRAALPKTVLLKLNGGLGTSMGLEQAKSLLPVKNDLTFLDVIARQAREAGNPLVLMNSIHTNADSLAALEKYPNLNQDLPLSFVQGEFPKINRADFTPAVWLKNPGLEWNPPGHGDIYRALVISDMLDKLVDAGYEYAFVSNSDNLGAVIDLSILGYFADNYYPFMMEVADRTEADKKGGHLARQHDGQLILRESAQCPPDEVDAFQNINRYKYFNTNNIWLNLHALRKVAHQYEDKVGILPMIVNPKTVDPRDRTSTPVYQLETAMGAAIFFIEGSQAIRVPRTRFAPVKTTNDLLAVQSDAYRITDEYYVVPDPGTVVVNLDTAYYKLIDHLDARFPAGPPSLCDCTHLTVQGDIKFGADVVCRGEVILINETGSQVEIDDGSIIEGAKRW